MDKKPEKTKFGTSVNYSKLFYSSSIKRDFHCDASTIQYNTFNWSKSNMLRAKAAMGFKSVKRVEVKAETTTPGEIRTTTDINGVRVTSNRARRTLPKLEFVVEENGAILHGSNRGHCPHFTYATNDPSIDPALLSNTNMSSFHGMQFRDIPIHSNTTHHNQQEEIQYQGEGDSLKHHLGNSLVPPMKDCVLNDTRATTLAIKYDHTLNKYVCGSSIERFSGHTGVCRVMGSKKYPIIPHTLAIGDLLRIGSVGLVVCEMNRTTSDETMETLSEEEYQHIRDQYLTGPLQQTFRHTHHNEDIEEEEEEEEEGEQIKVGRTGETSDEGESDDDGEKPFSEEEELDNQLETHPNGIRPLKSNMKPTKPTRLNGVNNTREKRFCYICYEGEEEEENPLVAPCVCKGDTKYVHLECLQRWNNNVDLDGTNPNHKMCAVTNTDGLDVCSICKSTYLTKVRLDDGRTVSLMAKKLAPPYVTFAVVTQHEARSRSTTLTNTRFQLSFAKYVSFYV